MSLSPYLCLTLSSKKTKRETSLLEEEWKYYYDMIYLERKTSSVIFIHDHHTHTHIYNKVDRADRSPCYQVGERFDLSVWKNCSGLRFPSWASPPCSHPRPLPSVYTDSSTVSASKALHLRNTVLVLEVWFQPEVQLKTLHFTQSWGDTASLKWPKFLFQLLLTNT